MTDPDRGLSSMSEEIKIKIKFLGQLVSEERKINGHFRGNKDYILVSSAQELKYQS